MNHHTWPTSTGSGCSVDAEARARTPAGDLARQRHQLGGRRAAAVDERERVLGGDPDAAVAVAAREPGALDQPRGRGLDRARRAREPRRARRAARAPRTPSGSRIGLVKNEPALTESGSAGSITMPLPRRSASTASRTSASGAPPPTGTPSVRASSA